MLHVLGVHVCGIYCVVTACFTEVMPYLVFYLCLNKLWEINLHLCKLMQSAFTGDNTAAWFILNGSVCITQAGYRALCRIKLLPVTYVLVDTWMLTVKLVYELSDVPDDLKWAKNTHRWHHLCSLSRHNWQYRWFWRKKFYFFVLYPSTLVFTHPNDGWTGLYIKLSRAASWRYSKPGILSSEVLTKFDFFL